MKGHQRWNEVKLIQTCMITTISVVVSGVQSVNRETWKVMDWSFYNPAFLNWFFVKLWIQKKLVRCHESNFFSYTKFVLIDYKRLFESHQKRNIVHGLEMGSNVLNSLRKLCSIRHVVLKGVGVTDCADRTACITAPSITRWVILQVKHY